MGSALSSNGIVMGTGQTRMIGYGITQSINDTNWDVLFRVWDCKEFYFGIFTGNTLNDDCIFISQNGYVWNRKEWKSSNFPRTIQSGDAIRITYEFAIKTFTVYFLNGHFTHVFNVTSDESQWTPFVWLDNTRFSTRGVQWNTPMSDESVGIAE